MLNKENINGKEICKTRTGRSLGTSECMVYSNEE